MENLFVCLCVGLPPPGSVGPKTGPKASELGKRPLNWAECPVWGYLAPTQTEIMLAAGQHQSSYYYFKGIEKKETDMLELELYIFEVSV